MNAQAGTLSSGSVGGFEDDGNLVEQPGVTGNLDWDGVDTQSPHFTRVNDDLADTGYVGSSKENSPEGFVCNNGGANPGKNDILRAYVNTRITGPTNQNPTAAFLDLAFVRAAGNGDAHVNFEFNRNAITNPCPYTGRTTGDLLLTFDYPGGSGTATVSAFRWDQALDGGLGDWVEFSLPSTAAAGTTNSGSVTDPIAGGTIAARRFGEATVDLVAFQNATDTQLLTCPGLGHVNIRSRSSGESFNSALQDRLPQQDVNLSTCGSVTLKKVDQNGDPLAGALFGLFDNQDGTGDPVATCTSDADGICKITNVAPGSYWVKEISAPDGYAIDDTAARAVDVADFQDVDLTDEPFSNTLETGFVHITKVLHDASGHVVTPPSDAVLSGTTFVLYQDANDNGVLDEGEESSLSGGGDATCTISTGSSCDIGPLELGDYRVAETVAPAGTTSAGDVDVSVTSTEAAAEVDYVNVLGVSAIQINKDGPELAHVGDTVTYSFEVTNTGALDLSSVDMSDPKCDSATLTQTDNGDGDDILAVGETWKFSCTHLVTASDADPLPNTATVSGTDDYGREVSDDDSHSVDIIHPAITIDKTANPTSVEPGQDVTFSYLVTNTGDTPLHDVKVTDDKLGDIGTVASLAPGASATLTKTVTVSGDSPTDNVGTVSGTDDLGKSVSATDTAHIDIVLPLVLARTGVDLMPWFVLGLALILFGMLMLRVSAPAMATVRQRQIKVKVHRRPQ